MTKLEAIAAAKQFRVELDAILQRMKQHSARLKVEMFDEEPAEPPGEIIAQHTLSYRDIEGAIMRQGMALKSIGNPNPYPNSYNPASPVVDPTADGLKL